MSDFKVNDKVVFKGDPEKAIYRVICVNELRDGSSPGHGTLELEPIDGDTVVLDWIPPRLVEAAPETFKDGDVVLDEDECIYITDGEGYFYEEIYTYVTRATVLAYDRDTLIGNVSVIGNGFIPKRARWR